MPLSTANPPQRPCAGTARRPRNWKFRCQPPQRPCAGTARRPRNWKFRCQPPQRPCAGTARRPRNWKFRCQPPQKILLTRIDRIGDVVLTTPVFQALRRHFPHGRIAVLVRRETKEIVEGNPFVDEVLVYDKEGEQRSMLQTLRFALSLRKKRFDVAVNFHATRRVHWISFLAGIPVRIGYRRKSSWLLTHTVEDRKKEGLRHESEYNFDLLSFLGVAPPDPLTLYFPLKDEDRVRLEKCFRETSFYPSRNPYAVLHPGASCPSKIWPAERFASLGDELWERYQLKSVLIGRDSNEPQGEQVKRLMRFPPIDMRGRLSLSMLGACLKEARLLVSNDSGPVHIGVAVGTPVLSIFGRNEAGLSVKRWGPLGEKSAHVQKDVGCYFCLAHRCDIGFLCLEALKVDEVLQTLRKMEAFFVSTPTQPMPLATPEISAC